MPRMSSFQCRERVKAYNAAIHALQLELDDPENGLHETQIEMAYLRDKLMLERQKFIDHHGIEI